MWFGEYPLTKSVSLSGSCLHTVGGKCPVPLAHFFSVSPDAALYRLLAGLPLASGIFWQLSPLPKPFSALPIPEHSWLQRHHTVFPHRPGPRSKQLGYPYGTFECTFFMFVYSFYEDTG